MSRKTTSDVTTNSATEDEQDDVSRRKYLKTSAGAAAVSTLGVAALSDQASADNIREENRRSGDDDWMPTAPGGTRPTGTHPRDVNHHIEGYPSRTSVAPEESLEFHVSTAPTANYRIDIYRLGWYGGAGGRQVVSLSEKRGKAQSIPNPDSETGIVECGWPVTDTLEVGEDWPTGAYMAKFVATNGKYAGESTGYVFTVHESEDRDADILVQLPNATSQAYNGWGGKSLYGFTSTDEKTENGTESADCAVR